MDYGIRFVSTSNPEKKMLSAESLKKRHEEILCKNRVKNLLENQPPASE